MGSSKKKDKKKRKKRTYEDESPERRYPSSQEEEDKSYSVQDTRNLESYYDDKDTFYKDSKSRKERNNYDRNIPETEEYVYDYDGQEVVHASRDMSISPERKNDNPNSINYHSTKESRKSQHNHKRSLNRERSPRYSDKRDRSRSPLQRSNVKELTPPPLPPGMDWPFEAPRVPIRPKSPPSNFDDSAWKIKDEQNRDRDYQDEVDRKYQEKQRDSNRKNESVASSQGDSTSLSIEETNKLRAKLGLKPLKADGELSTANEEKSYADRDDVHQPATNIAQKKTADKMREKMEAIREKRKINQKLHKVKGLGVDDDPVIDSAAAWVAKSRMQEKEKALATKRAQMLEEMDEEFGVSNLIEETEMIKKELSYSSRDLKGLKVHHKGSTFSEGSEVVLTLQDKGILDEDDEDVLMNINMQEAEKAKNNIENRRKKPGYRAYDEVDDETGMLKVRGVLDKYDEEIDGVKKASFKLDGLGVADLEGEDEMDQIRTTLKAQQVSLDMAAPRLARDYFTEEEMVKFKKPRKKLRKVRKRELFKADDLLKLDLDTSKDRGSRKLKSALKNVKRKDSDEQDMDIVPTNIDELDYFVAVNQSEEPVVIEDDDAEQELQLALERSRRRKKKKDGGEQAALEKVANEVLSKPKVQEMETEQNSRSKKKARSMIVLDSTSEFCRTLGELPTIGPTPAPPQKEHVSDDDMDIEDSTNKGGWEQVEITKGKNKDVVKVEEEEDDDVLEPEPIPHGMAATLLLADMKGYLHGKQKVRNFDPLNLPETKAEVDVEKLRDEEKSRYNSRGYDRDRYDPYAFKDKSNYKPNVKLDYVDNKGRQLSQKEAFRLLSHKFHGKGSGKLKTEKRVKKLIDEKKLLKMSSTDTPLNTASLFKEKQKQSQSAFLVLSGGGKNLLSGEALKK